MNKQKTLIILDWDDTMFPTSWIANNKINLMNISNINKYITIFSKLDMLLHKLLIKLLNYGKVIIVTNAMSKWIKISSTILPNTKKLIQKNIIIISARDTYQNEIADMMIWKKLIFKQLINNNKVFQNIISIGDAEYERRALISLYEYGKNRFIKSIKFISTPTFELLVDQLEVLINSINQICTLNDHLDLQFIITKNKSYV